MTPRRCAHALLLLAAIATAGAAAWAQITPGRDPPSGERVAALVPLLELQDMIYAARVARGGMTEPQAATALRAHAAAWLRDAPDVTQSELIKTLRGEAQLLLDYATSRVSAATRWPPDAGADIYKTMAEERLGRLGVALRGAPATQTAIVEILTGTVEVIGWTEGRASLAAANDPFAGSHARAMLAVVPSSPQVPDVKPATKPASSTPPPSPPPGTLKLVYFGLYDDRVGPRGPSPSGKPDGRFVLSIDVGRLSSRDLTHIALQAMDANSRPVGPIWHTRDPAQSLLLVVTGDQWLNTRHVNGLATLEGPEVDLILFADNAPEPTAVNAFIVEVGFADGSIARQLAKSR